MKLNLLKSTVFSFMLSISIRAVAQVSKLPHSVTAKQTVITLEELLKSPPKDSKPSNLSLNEFNKTPMVMGENPLFKKAFEKMSQGGVNGGGGNLPFLDPDSFDKFVRTSFPPYLRDLIHRIRLIQKNSPKDFIYPEYANNFLGTEEKALNEIMSKITFKTQIDGCSSPWHANNDASVTPDGQICFSYSAFKNLNFDSVIYKLLTLSLHEISHLRGFNEENAIIWQNLFERNELTRLGSKTILTFNEKYRNARESLFKITRNLSKALEYLLSRDKDSKLIACNYMSRAEERFQDFTYLGQLLPEYLFNDGLEVVTAVYRLRHDCNKMNDKQLASAIASMLSISRKFLTKTALYESSLCKDKGCESKYSQDADEQLISWEQRKQSFLNNVKYKKIAPENVKCSIQDITENKTYALKDEENLNGLNPEGVKALSKFFIGENDNQSGISMYLSSRNTIVHDSKNFTFGVTGLKGQLQDQGIEAWVHFSVTQDSDENFFVLDPYYFAAKKAPTALKKFKLTCKANNK